MAMRAIAKKRLGVRPDVLDLARRLAASSDANARSPRRATNRKGVQLNTRDDAERSFTAAAPSGRIPKIVLDDIDDSLCAALALDDQVNESMAAAR